MHKRPVSKSFPAGSTMLLAALLTLLLPLLTVSAAKPEDLAAREIIEKAFDYWRGKSSTSLFSMTIHRPDFERTMSMRGWTRGRQDALFFVEKPSRDAGNGTLKKGREMWSYNPKINRVIKLPPSMMSQSWMGSDFSNDDLAKTDSILDEYSHTVISQAQDGPLTIYEIESIAKEDAPVVWGKQVTSVREDGILLRQSFYDEEMVLVKEMLTENIESMGGRLFPRTWTMRRVDKQNQFTRLEYLELDFNSELPKNLFTITSLKTRKR